MAETVNRFDLDRTWHRLTPGQREELGRVALLLGFSIIGSEQAPTFGRVRTYERLNIDANEALHDLVCTFVPTLDDQAIDLPYPPHMAGVCRECGCTDDNACVLGDDDDAYPCHWVEDDLCSGCAPDDTR